MSDLRQQHRITARLTAALPPVPARLAGEIQVYYDGPDAVRIETPGELSPLLGWLATLPLAEVRIEPFRLRSIYDRFHGAEVQ
jgi:ABC-2 type transport system ATP-binding protein